MSPRQSLTHSPPWTSTAAGKGPGSVGMYTSSLMSTFDVDLYTRSWTSSAPAGPPTHVMADERIAATAHRATQRDHRVAGMAGLRRRTKPSGSGGDRSSHQAGPRASPHVSHRYIQATVSSQIDGSSVRHPRAWQVLPVTRCHWFGIPALVQAAMASCWSEYGSPPWSPSLPDRYRGGSPWP